jgi:hypothetical protein
MNVDARRAIFSEQCQADVYTFGCGIRRNGKMLTPISLGEFYG